jgi:hypothetical protein
MQPSETKIEIRNLTMAYGSYVVMSDINAQVKRVSIFIIPVSALKVRIWSSSHYSNIPPLRVFKCCNLSLICCDLCRDLDLKNHSVLSTLLRRCDLFRGEATLIPLRPSWTNLNLFRPINALQSRNLPSPTPKKLNLFCRVEGRDLNSFGLTRRRIPMKTNRRTNQQAGNAELRNMQRSDVTHVTL